MIVDGLETCDDGTDGDNDDGCTDLCLLPACGDGFVQASLGETCDQALGYGNTATLGDGPGAVKCWGDNASGALGIGNTMTIGANPGDMPPDPVSLGAEAVVLYTGGGFHNCAVLAGGAVRCWGYNAYGQLGIGSTQHLGDNEAVNSVPAIPIE